MKPKVAIIGGTGKIGSELVRTLLNEDYAVRMLVRSRAKNSFSHKNLSTVEGDARDIDSIKRLLDGCQVVINTIGQPKGESPLFSQVASNMVNALPEFAIKRYIVIAGLGLTTPNDKKRPSTKIITGIMHFLFPKIAEDKKKEYEQISSSNLDWTIVRIPKFKVTHSQEKVFINPFDCKGISIGSFDLINFLITQITDKTYYRSCPFISKG